MKPITTVLVCCLFLAFHATPAAANDCDEDAEYIRHLKDNIAIIGQELAPLTSLHEFNTAWYWRIEALMRSKCPNQRTFQPTLRCKRLMKLTDEAEDAMYESSARKFTLERRVTELQGKIGVAQRWLDRCLPHDPGPGSPRGCTPGTAFKHFPNQAIAGNNAATLPNVTVATCQQACLDQEGCKSFDYGPHNSRTKVCFLSYKNSANIGEPGVYFVGRPRGKSDWQYDYYERTCF